MKRKGGKRAEKIKQEIEEPEESYSDQGSSKGQGGTNGDKTRQDNSLSVLTKKFVRLIKSKPQNTIDLNDAVELLKVQKRRIYDITNVLEGIGYVQKIHKNTIKWMGESEELDNEKEIREYLAELSRLGEQEKKLNDELDSINKEIKENYLENEEFRKFQYITVDDCSTIAKAYCKSEADKKDKGSLVILSAPHGSTLQALQEGDGSSQLIMSSTGKGEIKVYLADHSGKVTQYKDD